MPRNSPSLPEVRKSLLWLMNKHKSLLGKLQAYRESERLTIGGLASRVKIHHPKVKKVLDGEMYVSGETARTLLMLVGDEDQIPKWHEHWGRIQKAWMKLVLRSTELVEFFIDIQRFISQLRMKYKHHTDVVALAFGSACPRELEDLIKAKLGGCLYFESLDHRMSVIERMDASVIGPRIEKYEAQMEAFREYVVYALREIGNELGESSDIEEISRLSGYSINSVHGVFYVKEPRIVGMRRGLFNALASRSSKDYIKDCPPLSMALILENEGIALPSPKKVEPVMGLNQSKQYLWRFFVKIVPDFRTSIDKIASLINVSPRAVEQVIRGNEEYEHILDLMIQYGVQYAHDHEIEIPFQLPGKSGGESQPTRELPDKFEVTRAHLLELAGPISPLGVKGVIAASAWRDISISNPKAFIRVLKQLCQSLRAGLNLASMIEDDALRDQIKENLTFEVGELFNSIEVFSTFCETDLAEAIEEQRSLLARAVTPRDGGN